jgi:hypothetical protein
MIVDFYLTLFFVCVLFPDVDEFYSLCDPGEFVFAIFFFFFSLSLFWVGFGPFSPVFWFY